MEALGGGIWTAVVGDWDRSQILSIWSERCQSCLDPFLSFTPGPRKRGKSKAWWWSTLSSTQTSPTTRMTWVYINTLESSDRIFEPKICDAVQNCAKICNIVKSHLFSATQYSAYHNHHHNHHHNDNHHHNHHHKHHHHNHQHHQPCSPVKTSPTCTFQPRPSLSSSPNHRWPARTQVFLHLLYNCYITIAQVCCYWLGSNRP